MEHRTRLEPVAPPYTIREDQSALVAATSPGLRETPQGDSLELSPPNCPVGGVRGRPVLPMPPGARSAALANSLVPLGENPSEGICRDGLLWLQAEPDATG